MFALVRTERGARKQDGITFLLVDLKSPGVRIEPIVDIAGMHELNQVFFDCVRVPVEDRVGAENDGWAVARRLMHLARSNNTPAALVRRAVRRAGAAIAEAGLGQDIAARTKLSALLIDLETFSQLERAALPSGRPGAGDATTPSMLRVIGAELHQRAATLWMEYAAPHGAARFGQVADEAATATARYLALRAATIYSGASEVQRNIMARALGF
jgi:acyl-CoA dehydrogenase